MAPSRFEKWLADELGWRRGMEVLLPMSEELAAWARDVPRYLAEEIRQRGRTKIPFADFLVAGELLQVPARSDNKRGWVCSEEDARRVAARIYERECGELGLRRVVWLLGVLGGAPDETVRRALLEATDDEYNPNEEKGFAAAQAEGQVLPREETVLAAGGAGRLVVGLRRDPAEARREVAAALRDPVEPELPQQRIGEKRRADQAMPAADDEARDFSLQELLGGPVRWPGGDQRDRDDDDDDDDPVERREDDEDDDIQAGSLHLRPHAWAPLAARCRNAEERRRLVEAALGPLFRALPAPSGWLSGSGALGQAAPQAAWAAAAREGLELLAAELRGSSPAEEVLVRGWSLVSAAMGSAEGGQGWRDGLRFLRAREADGPQDAAEGSGAAARRRRAARLQNTLVACRKAAMRAREQQKRERAPAVSAGGGKSGAKTSHAHSKQFFR